MKYLVFGPGGQGYFAMLGCVMTNVKDKWNEVEEISAASAGSLLAFLLLSPHRTFDEIVDMSFSLNVEELSKINLTTFINSFGFIDHEPIKQKLLEMWGGNPTFKELSKKFYISAFCLNTSEVEYFSVDTHPNMHVVEAVCMSISVPVMFAGYRFGKKMYLDGGTNEKIPGLPFLHKKRSDVTCVALVNTDRKFIEMNTLRDFFEGLLEPIRHNTIKYDLPGFFINTSGVNLLNMKMVLEEKIKLFLLGSSVAVA